MINAQARSDFFDMTVEANGITSTLAAIHTAMHYGPHAGEEYTGAVELVESLAREHAKKMEFFYNLLSQDAKEKGGDAE